MNVKCTYVRNLYSTVYNTYATHGRVWKLNKLITSSIVWVTHPRVLGTKYNTILRLNFWKNVFDFSIEIL